MSILYDSRRRAIDNSGVTYSGAKLTVYLANTTTPASLFSDANLAVPLTNPVTADSGGVFPQIFAADGVLFDTLLKTSGGVLIRSEDDVVALGANTSTFSRDFTNSRTQIRGVGGTVYFEAGDATGDDVGGNGRNGGWNGTQADTWTIDAAATALTGSLTVQNGKDIPGVVVTGKTAFTSASTVDITLTALPSTCVAWYLELFSVTTDVAGSAISARFSFDNGASYKSGATDYIVDVDGYNAAGAGGYGSIRQAGTAALIGTSQQQLGPATMPVNIQMDIRTPASGTAPTIITGKLFGKASNGPDLPTTQTFVGYSVGSFGKITNIRLYPVGGVISGFYRLVALNGYQ